MELTKHHKKEYGGRWGRGGIPPVPDLCAEAVYGGNTFPTTRQCTRKRGHGPDGAFCKQHDPDARAAKSKERREAWKKETRIKRWQSAMHEAAPSFLAVLRAIAKGCDDPQLMARCIVEEFDRMHPAPEDM